MQWNEKDNTITKTFEFSSYLDGIDFVNEVANLSEQENHHPDITVGYCKVTISLTTHDAGSLTEKDYKLATVSYTHLTLPTTPYV